MDKLIFIIINVLFPMAAIVGLGFVIQTKFKLDLRTLSRFMLYVLVPCLVFARVYDATLEWTLLGRVFLFAIVIMAIQFVVGTIAGKILKLPHSRQMAFGNSIMFFNSGNYGLPLVDLAFQGNPVAVTGQLLIMLIQNILGNSVGVFQAGRGSGNIGLAIKRVLSLPTLYVMLLVFGIKALNIQVPAPVLVPIHQIANGFVGFALFTLGASLPGISRSLGLSTALVSATIRLALAPAIGLLLLVPFGFSGVLAQSLVIGLATPTAINTIIIAREMDNEPEFMAWLVFVSTLLSPLTITIWLLILQG